MKNAFRFGLFIALFVARAGSAAIVYVDAGHCPSGDGSSWATAFCTIQEGINAAGTGDGVFVKKGTYLESITMRSGVYLFGGFAGTESVPDQRDISSNDTVIDASNAQISIAVRMIQLLSTRLDGFVLRGARTSAVSARNLDGSTSIANCRFERNGSGNGGAISVYDSAISIDNCSFIQNRSSVYGGAVYILDSFGTSLNGCLFDGNEADLGGAIGVLGSTATLSGCNFISNSANYGGAVNILETPSVVEFEGCSFFNNAASLEGGTIGTTFYGQQLPGGKIALHRCVVEYSSAPAGEAAIDMSAADSQILDSLISRNACIGVLLNSGTHNISQCTLTNNPGSAVYASGGANVAVSNSIFASSPDAAIASDGTSVAPGSCLFFKNAADISIGATVVSGGDNINANVPGAVDNLSGDPAFRNAAAQDFHLLATSAAIGMAAAIYATYTDLDGVARPTVEGQIDIGAYQFTDAVPPTVVSITRADASPTKAGLVHYNVVFDEAVQGVSSNDFAVVALSSAKAVSGASVTSVTGANDRYVVTVNTGSGDGALRLDLVDNDSILDFNNNLLGGPGAGNGSLEGEEYVIDKTAPVLTLTGDTALVLEAGSYFVEPGVDASDNLDGDISNRVIPAGFVNVGELGTYTITYTVSDAAGNEATATRTVTIVDTTPPVITLYGENPVTVSFGTPYTDPGATAFDILDGDVSASLVLQQPADVSTPGSYQYTFTATDHSGNAVTAVRVLNLVDDTPPVITLNGDAYVTVNLGQPYTDAGATAQDNVDGDISGRIEVSGGLTTARPGTYTITYRVTDSAGNRTTTTRTVEVLDRPDFYVTPAIQFISSFARTVAFDVYNRSTSATKWKAEVIEGGSWCKIVAGDSGELFYGQIYVEAEDNTSSKRRVAKIQISNGEKFALPLTVEVSQAPTPKGWLGCGGEGSQNNGPMGDAVLVAVLGAALFAARGLRAKA